VAGLPYGQLGRMTPGMVMDLYLYRRAYDDQQHGIRRKKEQPLKL